MPGVLDRVRGWLFEEGEEPEVAPIQMSEEHSTQVTPKKRKPSILSLHNL